MFDKYDQLFIATTDTVVGIGSTISEKNKKLINGLKKSPLNKRLIIMVSSIKMANDYFKNRGFDKKSQILAQKYWPGSTTLVCNEKLAIRMPNNKLLLTFIENIGPIYMTSANKSGEKPLIFQEAIKEFFEVKKHYNFGEGSNKPSKIIDVKSGKVIRN